MEVDTLERHGTARTTRAGPGESDLRSTQNDCEQGVPATQEVPLEDMDRSLGRPATGELKRESSTVKACLTTRTSL